MASRKCLFNEYNNLDSADCPSKAAKVHGVLTSLTLIQDGKYVEGHISDDTTSPRLVAAPKLPDEWVYHCPQEGSQFPYCCLSLHVLSSFSPSRHAAYASARQLSCYENSTGNREIPTLVLERGCSFSCCLQIQEPPVVSTAITVAKCLLAFPCFLSFSAHHQGRGSTCFPAPSMLSR